MECFFLTHGRFAARCGAAVLAFASVCLLDAGPEVIRSVGSSFLSVPHEMPSSSLLTRGVIRYLSAGTAGRVSSSNSSSTCR